MKIKPKLNYSVSGYGELNKDKIYSAIDATNQDNWKKEGKIFVQPNDDLPIELLLKRGDYEILLKPKIKDPVFQAHLKHMESEGEFFRKYKAKTEN